MANLGVQPTKTSVRITSSTGDFGTIPAATTSAAGAATADQVQRWDDAWSWMNIARADGELLPPAPAVDMSQYVTRGEVQRALQRVSQIPVPQAVQQMPSVDVTPRLAALETAIRQIPAAQQIAPQGDLEDRVNVLEEAVNQLLRDGTSKALSTKVQSLEDTLRKLYFLVSEPDEDAA